MKQKAPAFSTSRRATLLAGAGIILAAWAAYHNSLAGPFIYDDGASIVKNPTIRRLWPVWEVLSPPYQEGVTVGGRPLLNLSLALNHAFGGTAVRGYHLLNLGIHSLAGLVLFGVVRRTLRLCSGPVLSKVKGPALLQPALRVRFGTASSACAMAAALLWTVHPLQTESVTYVVQRAESLMGLFYLLTLYCFIRGTESPPPGRRFDKPFDRLRPRAESSGLKAPSQSRGRFDRPFDRLRPRAESSGLKAPSESRGQSKGRFDKLKALSQSKGWHTLAVAACLAGMATKEVMVSAPLMVLLYDRTFVSGTFREAWRRNRGLYAGLAGTWLLLGCLVAGTGGNRGGSIGLGGAWWDYGLTQFRAITHYLRLSIWPHPLVFDYGAYWIRPAAEAMPDALIVAPLLAGTLLALWHSRSLGFAGGWFFAILAPTSLVPGTTQMIVEHRMYLPLAAVVTPAVLGIHALAGRRGLVLFFALAVGLGFLTSRRNEDYRSDLAIWGDTVAKRPDNAHARNNFGYALVQAGRMAEAMDEYAEALRIMPGYAKAHTNLGNGLFRMGRVPEAIGHYERALQLQPGSSETQYNLGNALLQAGRLAEAGKHYQEAIHLNPEFAEAHNNLGYVFFQLGRLAEAEEHYEQALRIRPDYAKARASLDQIHALRISIGRED